MRKTVHRRLSTGRRFTRREGRKGMSHFFIIPALILSILLIPGEAHSFKDTEHARFTETAWVIYAQWLEFRGERSAIKDIDAVIAGTVDEDAKTLSRARNWHFFNPDNLLRNGRLFNRHSGPRLAELVSDLSSQCRNHSGQEATGPLAGRILHHIQDMSVPAHAVPIYHGPGLPDSFELYVGANMDRLSLALQPAQLDAELQSLPDKPWNQLAHFLYAREARETLRTIRQPIPIETAGSQLHWTEFWTPCDQADSKSTCDLRRRGFGVYGALGNSFGENALPGGVHVEPVVYADFLSHRHRQLITATVLWLYVYDQLLRTNCAGTSAEDTAAWFGSDQDDLSSIENK